MLKKVIKIILIVVGILILLVGILIGSFVYAMRYKIDLIDTSTSPGNVYEVKLQSVGEPYWPFGASPGQLVLMKGNREITKVNFEVSNDGVLLSENDWRTTWFDDRVEVLLSGEEQADVLWVLYFNGNTKTESLHTKYGEAIIYPTEDFTESQNFVESESLDDITGSEANLYMLQIEKGYLTIYNALYESRFSDFEVVYGAKESSSRCFLYETENTVNYLAYDRESKNGKCGLYVRYKVTKDSDDNWSYENATIENTYAYVYKTGEIISSEKKSWQDTGTEWYQNATGEY